MQNTCVYFGWNPTYFSMKRQPLILMLNLYQMLKFGVSSYLSSDGSSPTCSLSSGGTSRWCLGLCSVPGCAECSWGISWTLKAGFTDAELGLWDEVPQGVTQWGAEWRFEFRTVWPRIQHVLPSGWITGVPASLPQEMAEPIVASLAHGRSVMPSVE